MSLPTAWRLYSWIFADDLSLIHPDDRPRLDGPAFLGGVLQWIRDTPDGYVVLRKSNGDEYRGRPRDFRPLPTPALCPGTPVRTNETPSREGTIYALEWHFQRNRYLYFVQVGAKFSRRQFYDSDLTLPAPEKEPDLCEENR